MKKILLLGLIYFNNCNILFSQTYLPLTGGSLTGNLGIGGGANSQNLFLYKRLGASGTADFIHIGQHSLPFHIYNTTYGPNSNRKIEMGVLDNGTAVLQANAAGEGYFPIHLNPVAGGVMIGIGNTMTTNYSLQVGGASMFAGSVFVNGNMGIGTSTPQNKLHLFGDHGTTQFRLTLPANLNGAGNGEINLQSWVSEPGVTWDAGGIGMNVNNEYDHSVPTGFKRINTQIGQSYIRFIPNGGAMEFNTIDNAGNSFRSSMYLKNGSLGIGTTTPTEKLTVNGSIRAKKLIVTQSGWSDYVFAKNYNLRTLAEVENYIKVNQHLPEVPSAKVEASKGINVGDTQALLLKKIEELTLYMIQQEKRINELEKNQRTNKAAK